MFSIKYVYVIFSSYYQPLHVLHLTLQEDLVIPPLHVCGSMRYRHVPTINCVSLLHKVKI